MIEIDSFGEDGKIVDENLWSAPKMVYEQKRGEMPYLIANKPIKASNGDLILPFWQEYNFKYESSIRQSNAFKTVVIAIILTT